MTRAKKATELDEEGVSVLSAEETTVQINGLTYDIPRGVEVVVPLDVAAALEEAGFLAGPED